MDSVLGAVSPENVGYGMRAETQGSSFPGNSEVARNKLLRGMAPSPKAAAWRSLAGARDGRRPGRGGRWGRSVKGGGGGS